MTDEINRKHAPTERDVSTAVAAVRSGVIIGYTSPESAAERLRKIAEEYADLVERDRVITMFNRVSTTTDAQPRIDEVLALLG